jgi:hypothetical protein
MKHRNGPRWIESLEFYASIFYMLTVNPLKILATRLVFGPYLPGASFFNELMNRSIAFMNKRFSIQQ